MRILFSIILFLIIQSINAQIKGIDLLGGELKVEIPFSFEQDYILIDVILDDKITLKFIYDTGASHTILFEKIITDLLGAPYDGKINIRGSDLQNDVSALICRNRHMQINNLQVVSRDILVLEENYLKLHELTGLTIHGIIGASFFQNLVASINYKKKKLVFYHPEHFQTPGKKYSAFPIQIKNSKPYLYTNVESEISDSTSTLLLLDTGAALTLLLHTNILPDFKMPEKLIVGNLGLGIGGFLTGYVGRTKGLDIGHFRFDNLLTNYQNVDTFVVEDKAGYRDGIIGNSLLSRFHVIIDYSKELLYLKPEKKYNEAFQYDKSGIFILAFGEHHNEYIISAVIKESPADLAGLEPGDIIKKFGFWNSRFLSISHITNKLAGKEGKKIRMKIKRGDRTKKVNFRLKELI